MATTAARRLSTSADGSRVLEPEKSLYLSQLLLLVIPHATAARGNRWELAIPKPFLKTGVFHLQQVQPISLARFDTRMGALTPDEFGQVKRALARLLNLTA
jgi:mRNA-degrading endonuclease toxin of MazEF toxin-antitoxin module